VNPGKLLITLIVSFWVCCWLTGLFEEIIQLMYGIVVVVDVEVVVLVVEVEVDVLVDVVVEVDVVVVDSITKVLLFSAFTP